MREAKLAAGRSPGLSCLFVQLSILSATAGKSGEVGRERV